MNKITKISFIKGYGLRFLPLGLTNLDLRFTVKWWDGVMGIWFQILKNKKN